MLSILAKDHDAEVELAVAGNPLCPASALETLSRNENSVIREAAVANPSMPTSVLEEIVKADSISEREKLAIAANPSASAVSLSELRMTPHFSSQDAEHQMLVSVALNPNASAGTLRDLFQRDEKSPTQREINRAIAGNPAAPLDTRAELFGMDTYRDLVLANELRQSSQSRIACARAASNCVAELLSHSPDSEVRRAVALAPGASDTILAVLSDDPAREVSSVARARWARGLGEIEDLTLSTDGMVIEALIMNANIPVDHKAAAVEAGLPLVGEDTLMDLAKDPGTPSQILSGVLDRGASLTPRKASELKNAIASNPRVSAETLRTLAMDNDLDIRKLMANSPMVPMDSLVKLASDADPKIREIVASNSITPVELLLRSATDDVPAVVRATAIHPKATAAVLDRVVKDQLERRKNARSKSAYSRDLPNFSLRPLYAVAANPRTDKDTLRTLADSVDRALNDNLGYSRDETAIEREVGVWTSIAGNPSATDDLLDKIARAVHEMVWTKTDPDRGRIGLESLRELTLKSVVKNPSVSVATLDFLSSGDWVARRTTKRSEREDGHTTTWKVWDRPATAAAKQDMASAVKKELSRLQWRDTSNSKNRLEFASNPEVSLEILEELSGDSDVAVRSAVAGNPSTDPKMFHVLVADPATEVRLAAAAATHPDLASVRHESYLNAANTRESCYRTAFEYLAQDQDATVRSAVADNLSVFWNTLSQEARDRYAFDDHPVVRASLIRAVVSKECNTFDRDFGLSAEALVHLVDTSDADLWRILAGKGLWGLPATVLNRLADTGDSETVVAVVKAFDTDLPLLIRFAASEDSAVVEAVSAKRFFRDEDRSMHDALVRALLKNPLTPGDYLMQFVRSNHVNQEERFLKLAIAHPNFPETALIEYASGTNERLIRAAASSDHMKVLVAVASNPAAPIEALSDLTERVAPEVRNALIENKSTPPELLFRLIEAGNL
ncbi:hypothetical protein ICL81_07490 [Leucobacter sp. cx-328]|uniref:hypothetical protein n=1 Tax=unclassified Leucobacter TaxID=2621730 RepID=UPI00165D8073|nr:MULTISPECIES: hypothetical protein [unclassified Leucobacter]MBC9944352.1 hypothetical protein [Leucobacter sp. cx-328]